ncbi:MAG: threonine--tRNA ligase, partial [Bacilli bacterium]|nr:threonine--tRNA ligase [Bacilli bacterium]
MLKVELKDGKIMEVAEGKSFGEICVELSPSLRKKTLVAKVDGKMVDLSAKPEHDCKLEFITLDDEEAFEVLNHSCAHLLAQAMKRLYPKVLFWVGPAIEEGFYYDMDLQGVTLTEEDLVKVENEMKKIAKEGEEIKGRVISKQEALEIFKANPYKIELINNLPENEKISCYAQGEFIDLCRGPHIANAKELKHFKLLKASGAYYKGDSKNKMLQRVYGICFPTKGALDAHLYMLEEAKKRDHKKLGKEMGLFMFSEYGPGLPFWLPDGLILKKKLEEFVQSLLDKYDYQTIETPILLNRALWEISGHWDHYKENMFTAQAADEIYAVKPMNCPGAILVYKNELHSYRDLPLRYSEFGHDHRYEASGALNGLFRARGFTQDDAHIFLAPEQIKDEVGRVIAFFDEVYSTFGLDYSIELSTRPVDNFIGEVKDWDAAEEALRNACLATKHNFKINPGDGAFYGPKLDFKLKDSLGRVWQCGTVQLDMQLPGRFDCTYVAEDGSKKTPVMLHRAACGSVERLMGILIENYAGNFPLWLAPNQVEILPVSPEAHEEHAEKLLKRLKDLGIRAKID